MILKKTIELQVMFAMEYYLHCSHLENIWQKNQGNITIKGYNEKFIPLLSGPLDFEDCFFFWIIKQNSKNFMMLCIWNIDLKSKRSHLTMINVSKPSITGGLTFSKSTAIYQHILTLVFNF